MHFKVKTQTVNNVWDLSKLVHEGKDTPAKLILEVSKLINNLGSTEGPFQIPDQDNYFMDDVTRLATESSKHLKNHLMKTLYITNCNQNTRNMYYPKNLLISKKPTTCQSTMEKKKP